MITTIGLLWHLVTASIRGQMQYRLNFVIGVLSGLFFQGIGIVFVWAILETFTSLGGWSFTEIALLYGLRLTAHGLYLTFFSNFFSIDEMVREGRYDRLLVRPIHPLLQLMFSEFRITVLGDLLGGIAILAAALSLHEIDWTPAKVLLIVGAIVGGAMIDGAFQILPASFAFRYIETWPARVIFDDIFSRFGNYPANIFGYVTERMLTFFIPLAFVAWLPAATLLHKPTYLPSWAGWLSLPIGITVFATAILMFIRNSRQYQSSGS
jgi:ABC-2 type transport system permease protein